ncbi:hypothetical protein GCK32_011867 [Trichostrongylus colubriformis]|uniref:Uncharacterized protein n=1 Tax=Trichostrongylus colubriformis TaxID=6319 RepID=A0AAN8IL98_TRICO
MSSLAIILLSANAMLSLSMLTVCKQKKRKKIYKPGHIPEFENPENEESDTYYGLNSSRLFPDREKGRLNRSAMDEGKDKVEGTTPLSRTPQSDVLDNAIQLEQKKKV